MSISLPSPARARPRRIPLPRARSLPMPPPELAVLALLAAVLNLWSLSTNGWANEYYAAAVRSMSTSWHDFLYNSFDSSGVMTVDKPPLALWVQALSVRAFGFNSWAMLAPQALMGVASVGLTYDLVRRRFGRLAGTIGGFALATTPIAVAVSRHNNPDALLVLCSVAALWCVVRALEDGRTRWLLWAGLAIGLGFQTKMLAGVIVLPALALAYLWVAPRGRLTAVRQLLAGGGVLAAVAASWPLLVWLTPASDRPWVSGTSDNSIWSLIFNYNGLGRVDGQQGGPGGAGGPGGGPGGGVFGGETGAGRLLNQALGGQAGWLLGFAAVALVGLLLATRLRRADARTGWVIAAGGAFVTIAYVFSTAKGIFHPYYVSLLAPFTAALVGAGAALLLEGTRLTRVLAPLALAGGVATELVVLHDNPDSLTWLAPILIAVAAVAAIALAATGRVRERRIALLAALAVLAIAPATWAVQTLGHATSGTFPAGGPQSASTMGGPGGFGRGMRMGMGGPPPGMRAGQLPPGVQAGQVAPFLRSGGGMPGGAGGPGGGGMFGNSQGLTTALAYAKAHGGGSVAVASQSGAAGSVITSGANVVAIGGFSGRESQVSTSWLAQAVASGKIRWVLADSGGGMPGNDGRVGAKDVLATVASTCRKVTLSDGTVLYDCQGYAQALTEAAS